MLRCLRCTSLEAIVICPSNPYISIDPMLAIPGLRDALRGAAVPVVAVSPLVGGAAVKGPTAKMMQELGRRTDHSTILAHYGGLLDGLIVDEALPDSPAAAALHVAPTLMRNIEDRERLARVVLRFAGELGR